MGRQLARGRSTPICLIRPVYKLIAVRRDPGPSPEAPALVSSKYRAVVVPPKMTKEGSARNKARLFLVMLFMNS